MIELYNYNTLYFSMYSFHEAVITTSLVHEVTFDWKKYAHQIKINVIN